jgi:hypothetical protein
MPGSKKSAIKKDSAATAVQQILSLFGPPPLLSTEHPEHFDQILAHFVSAIEPTCAIVQIWIYDIAVLVWEMMRLRRYKAMLIEEALPEAFRKIARQFIGDDGESAESERFADIYYRDPEKRQVLADALAAYNLTTDIVDAEAFHSSWKIEKIDSMLAALQTRRDAIIREIGAYRDSLARRVKKAVDDVIDVPAKNVEITPRLASPHKKSRAA